MTISPPPPPPLSPSPPLQPPSPTTTAAAAVRADAEARLWLGLRVERPSVLALSLAVFVLFASPLRALFAMEEAEQVGDGSLKRKPAKPHFGNPMGLAGA
jgi:hypothetical protein